MTTIATLSLEDDKWVEVKVSNEGMIVELWQSHVGEFTHSTGIEWNELDDDVAAELTKALIEDSEARHEDDVVKRSYGDSHWDEHPEHPVEDWITEVQCDSTRQGYHEWVEGRVETDKEESDPSE